QFAGKEELFVAVYEQIETEIVARIAGVPATGDPTAALHAGIDSWLAACADPEVHRIVLIEAPAALGWERWRDIGRRYAVGLIETTVQGLIDGGVVARQPVRPLAHVLLGALEEAALYAARADDRATATAEVRFALVQLVDGLLRR
ncbi:MAG TPA: TetR/AcrR family transcriptional regulator, partial [Pseudonocardia sp.]|nr:TetR/AcrR family transcriptional regulator [Pseudonocardia sp.]